MLEKEVKELLSKNGLQWEDFAQWIIGQTVHSNENGETLYFEWDVKRYINAKTKGKSTYFD